MTYSRTLPYPWGASLLVYHFAWMGPYRVRSIGPAKRNAMPRPCSPATAQLSPAWNAVLRREGGEVCRDCHHVVDAQFLHDAMHQRR